MRAAAARTIAVAAVAALTVARAATGQAQVGLIVAAHGADSTWNAKVREVVAQVAWPHGPIAVAFLMGEEAEISGWDSAVTRVVHHGAERAVAVPLLVSSFSSHYRQVEYYAGVRDTLEAHMLRHHHVRMVPPPIPVTVTPALDSAPELQAAIVARWHALEPRDRVAPVVLVAHGPNDDEEAACWLAHLRQVAAGVRAAGAPVVQVHLLRDDAPPAVRRAAVAAMRDSARALAVGHGDSVVALPLLISSGALTQVKIPRDLAELPVRYHPMPLAPHPALARWIERVAGGHIGVRAPR